MIEAGVSKVRFRALKLSLRGKMLPPTVIEYGGCKISRFRQRLRALQLHARKLEKACRNIHPGLGRIESRLIGPAVDREQKVALVDDRAVLKVHLGEVAAYAGSDIDIVDRLEPSDELVVLHDIASDGLRDRDDRRLLLGE